MPSETPPKRAHSALRALALTVHRYVGLAIASFVAVAGITGSLLAFQHELDALLAPELLTAQPPFDGAPRLDLLDLHARLSATLPEGVHANTAQLTLEVGQAAEFYLDVPESLALVQDDQVFVDPYTGVLTGSRRWGKLEDGLASVMPFVFLLHSSLALDDVGALLLGVASLLWTVDCFVGAYLTLPPRDARVAARSPSTWLKRWGQAFALRMTSWLSLVFTWHRSSGLWLWATLLVFAWSGVALNLNQVYEPVMRATFGMHEDHPIAPPVGTQAGPKPVPQLSFQAARERGRQLMAVETQKRGIEVHAERRLGYDPRSGVFRYQVHSDRDISVRYPQTTVRFDGDTGALVDFHVATGETAGDTITTWLYQLHFGTITMGGLPYRVFVVVLGLASTLLSVSGAWLWARKFARRRRAGR